jgi:hypothetical protein
MNRENGESFRVLVRLCGVLVNNPFRFGEMHGLSDRWGLPRDSLTPSPSPVSGKCVI